MRPRLFTPAGFVVAAVLLGLIYAALSACGARECTSVLAMTWPADVPPAIALVCCLAFLAAHFVAILLAPALVIAAGLWRLGRALRRAC